MTLALLLLARTPVDGNWAIDILPATIALGIGAGIAFNPILLAAMSGVAPEQAGLASGVVNTSFMMGGAVGLAILASLAASRSDNQLASGVDSLVALNSGYHLAFLVGAVFLVAAGSVAAVLLDVESPQAHGQVVAAVVADPVDEERRRAVDAAASAAQKVFAQSLRVRVRLEVAARNGPDRGPARFAYVIRSGVSSRSWLLEEPVVHLPETTLRTGRLCGLGRLRTSGGGSGSAGSAGRRSAGRPRAAARPL